LAQATEAERLRSSALRLRWLVGALTLMFLIAVAAFFLAWKNQVEAQTKAKEAARAQGLAETERQRAVYQESLANKQAKDLELVNKTLKLERQGAEAQATARRRAELGLAQAKLAKERSEKEAAAREAKSLKNLKGALLQDFDESEPGRQQEGLRLLTGMLKFYQDMKNLGGQEEILIRMARLHRVLGNENEAQALEKRAAEIQERQIANRSRRR
jgi:hypothetical protein